MEKISHKQLSSRKTKKRLASQRQGSKRNLLPQYLLLLNNSLLLLFFCHGFHPWNVKLVKFHLTWNMSVTYQHVDVQVRCVWYTGVPVCICQVACKHAMEERKERIITLCFCMEEERRTLILPSVSFFSLILCQLA